MYTELLQLTGVTSSDIWVPTYSRKVFEGLHWHQDEKVKLRGAMDRLNHHSWLGLRLLRHSWSICGARFALPSETQSLRTRHYKTTVRPSLTWFSFRTLRMFKRTMSSSTCLYVKQRRQCQPQAHKGLCTVHEKSDHYKVWKIIPEAVLMRAVGLQYPQSRSQRNLDGIEELVRRAIRLPESRWEVEDRCFK